MTRRDQSVKTYSGTPPAGAFGAAEGTPIVIDYAAAIGYFMHPITGAVTALGGGGGGGSGTVTSVGLSTPNSTLSLGGTNPVTTTGVISADINLGHRNEWTATQNVGAATLTDGATITPNGATSNNFYLLTTSAVGASRIMAVPTSINAGDIVNFEVVQPHTGGPCVIAWAAGYLWGKGGQDPQPIASALADTSDFYSFTVQHDGNLHGVMIGQSGPTGAGYTATSVTSLTTAGSGSQGFVTQFGLAYTVGARMRATSRGTGEYMEGVVTQYAAGVLTMTADLASGSGTHADWNINVTGNLGSTGPAGPAGAAGAYATSGRLTLTSGVPVTTSDVTGATSIFFTPYKGNQIQLWDGANWTNYTFVETTLALGTLASATIPNDVFARQVSGVLTLNMLAWASASARATAVTIQDGRYCKSGDKTRLYLGSFYPTSATTTEDSGGGTTTQVGGKRFLFNHYNQERRNANVKDTSALYVYGTATWRQANAAAGNRVEYMCGLPMEMTATSASLSNCSAAVNTANGIGIDSTTVNSAQLSGGQVAAGGATLLQSHYRAILAAGYHAINWLEIGGGTGTQNWLTNAGVASANVGLISEASF